MKVLVAPDKFKGSVTAADAARAIAEGLHDARIGIDVDLCPIADGGEGSVDTALLSGFRRFPADVSGPTGRPVSTYFGLRGDVALVELASASGMSRLPGNSLAPMTSSTRGVGQLIARAMDAGARTVIVAIGGSASTDGGSGMLAALGARIEDATGAEIEPSGVALESVHRVDLSGLDRRLAGTSVVIASDVENPLLGGTGAAAVYGPQKGADGVDIERLERGLVRWRNALAAATGRDTAEIPGAGAAGGVGFGATTGLGAGICSGADIVFELLDVPRRVTESSLVVTGEGALDGQTLSGKGPARIAQIANAHDRPCAAIAGRISLDSGELKRAGFDWAVALSDLEPDPQRCMSNARGLLISAATQLMRSLTTTPETTARRRS